MASALEIDVFARTIDGEAEGCGARGMTAVGCVMWNRVQHPRWWGQDIVSVCRDPWQFSCWNPGPDCERIKRLNEVTDNWFSIAIGIAQLIASGKQSDITGGADSYYAKSMTDPPSWAARAVQTYEDEWHRFFRVELPAPSGDPEAPTMSVWAAPMLTADDLNEAELKGLGAALPEKA